MQKQGELNDIMMEILGTKAFMEDMLRELKEIREENIKHKK